MMDYIVSFISYDKQNSLNAQTNLTSDEILNC